MSEKYGNAWLVRPIPQGTNRMNEFQKDHIIAIGWPNIGNLTGKTRQDIKKIIAGKPYEYEGLKLGNAYATIDIFVNRMQIGDLVLIPDGEDIYFGKIISDYFLEENVDSNDKGYPHQRKVEWLTNFSRKDLSKELRMSLKVHRTTADLSHHYAEINAFSKGTPLILENVNSKKVIEVNYPLRPDFNVTFKIPTDFTKAESSRLCMYFQSLYFRE